MTIDKPKICFDVDGTLTDSLTTHIHFCNYIADHFNLMYQELIPLIFTRAEKLLVHL